MLTRVLLTYVVLLLSPYACFADFFGPVISVLDVDTIMVLHNRHPERIRLNGIDCPERGQAVHVYARSWQASHDSSAPQGSSRAHSECSRKSVLGATREVRHDADGDHRQSKLSGLPSARLPQLHRHGSQESCGVHQRIRSGSSGVPPGEELSARVSRCRRESNRDLSFLQ